MENYHIRTYGRIRCRSLNTDIMKNNPYLHKEVPKDFIDPQKLTLEIGFGNGEVLLHRAQNVIDYMHIGVEVYQNGICKVLKEIHRKSINNIQIYNCDIRDFFSFSNFSFEEIYVLFPDPWHRKSEKKKNKKRLINEKLIEEIHRHLTNEGSFFFATDHKDYYDSVRNFIIKYEGFKIIHETINIHPNNNFIISNYEKKATTDCYYLKVLKLKE
jgi:tRNA (guanine-N7-)-methyltransferase